MNSEQRQFLLADTDVNKAALNKYVLEMEPECKSLNPNELAFTKVAVIEFSRGIDVSRADLVAAALKRDGGRDGCRNALYLFGVSAVKNSTKICLQKRGNPTCT
jgi:hypothetical protein